MAKGLTVRLGGWKWGSLDAMSETCMGDATLSIGVEEPDGGDSTIGCQSVDYV